MGSGSDRIVGTPPKKNAPLVAPETVWVSLSLAVSFRPQQSLVALAPSATEPAGCPNAYDEAKPTPFECLLEPDTGNIDVNPDWLLSSNQTAVLLMRGHHICQCSRRRLFELVHKKHFFWIRQGNHWRPDLACPEIHDLDVGKDAARVDLHPAAGAT